jgi:hypothetical protein
VLASTGAYRMPKHLAGESTREPERGCRGCNLFSATKYSGVNLFDVER